MNPIYLIFFVFFIRTILSFFIPIVADEASHLLFITHFKPSYIEYPPLIIWVNAFFISIFKEPLLSIRIASLFSYSLTCWFLYRIGCQFLSKKHIYYMILLFMLIPYHFFLGVTMQAEQLLLLCCMAATFYFIRLINTSAYIYFFPFALMCGLACLASYSAIFLVIGFIVCLCFLKKSHFYISIPALFAIAIILICLLPILFWNIEHHWVSFDFYYHHLTTFNGFSSLFFFLLNQWIFLSPLLLLYIFKSFFIKKKSVFSDVFYYLSLFCWLPYFCIGIYNTFFDYQMIFATIPMVIFVAYIFRNQLVTICRYQFIITAIIGILLFNTSSITAPLDAFNNYNLHHTYNTINNTQPSSLYIFTHDKDAVGVLSYYAQQPVYLSTQLNSVSFSQFMLSPTPQITPQDSILFYGQLSPSMLQELSRYFDSIQPVTLPSLALLEPHIHPYTFYLFKSATSSFTF